MNYMFLSLAVVAQVVATLALKPAQGFTRLWPSLLVLGGFIVAFYFLSQAVRTMSVGVAYATWAGFGILSLAIVGMLFQNKFDIPSLVGIILIVAGVIIINLFSGTIPVR